MEGPESILGGLSGSVWDSRVWMAKGGVASGKHFSPPFQPIKCASPVALLGECVCVYALGWAVGWDSLAALCLCRFRGEEWSVCVLSTVIKEKEIFH